MKKVIKKKLELNKNTISSLNNQQLGQVHGGGDSIQVCETVEISAGGSCPWQNTCGQSCTNWCTANCDPALDQFLA